MPVSDTPIECIYQETSTTTRSDPPACHRVVAFLSKSPSPSTRARSLAEERRVSRHDATIIPSRLFYSNRSLEIHEGQDMVNSMGIPLHMCTSPSVGTPKSQVVHTDVLWIIIPHIPFLVILLGMLPLGSNASDLRVEAESPRVRSDT